HPCAPRSSPLPASSTPLAPSLPWRRLYRQTPLFFFFTDAATTEIYTLSLHDALPIWTRNGCTGMASRTWTGTCGKPSIWIRAQRSEEHTSELQSRENLVCRLLLEKKKKPDRRQARAARDPRGGRSTSRRQTPSETTPA